MNEHVSRDCPWTVVSCKFASIGCKVKKARKNMASHEGNDPFHLQMALNAIAELKAAQSQPKTVENGSSTTFAVSDYGKLAATGDVFTMPSFYVSRYHVTVKVYSSGHSVEHLSVRALILKGTHDASLKWPFHGEVSFSLLNQLGDLNHRTEVLRLGPRDNARAGDIVGFPEFIPNSALAHNPAKNTQYLKDDTLYFRMSVKVANHKPWLQCKIHHLYYSAMESAVEKSRMASPVFKRGKPTTFALRQFSAKKGASEQFFSPPFYSGPNGYHMRAKVDANGVDHVTGSHVSMFIYPIKGTHNAGLKWPLTGKITFTLLNQLEDKTHHAMSMILTEQKSVKVGVCWGFAKFIHHSALAHDTAKNKQYLKDDTLYFRVSVEVANSKPWLE